MQRPVVRFKDLIEKYLAFVGENIIIDAKPYGKQCRLRLPVSQQSTIVTPSLAFTSSTPSLDFVAPSMIPLTTVIVRQELLSYLGGQCRTSVYQAFIDCGAMHGEVVGLDLTIVISHSEVLNPSEVWGRRVVRRVA